jgi:hypothetical protein
VVVDTAEFVDYTGQRKSLELRAGALKPGTRVLVVDEWIERQGGVVAGVATINVDVNDNTRVLIERYNCQSLWRDG